MRPWSVAISIVVALLSGGCCCCQQGFSLHGDWSVQMDPLPAQCGHGGCSCGGPGYDAGGANVPPLSAAPATSPRFQPLPTAPVANVMLPTPALAEHGQLAQAPAAVVESVLVEPAESSSWMFVERPASVPRSAYDVAHRRQLTADAWDGTRGAARMRR